MVKEVKSAMLKTIKKCIPGEGKIFVRKIISLLSGRAGDLEKYEFRRFFMKARRVYLDRGSEIAKVLLEGWSWYKFDGHPKDRRMRIHEEKDIAGMNTENIRFLINEIVKRYAVNGVYLEVGMFQGSSLLSAALYNGKTRCIGIDNFSQFDEDGKNEAVLKQNLSKCGSPSNIEIYNMDYTDGIRHLFGKDPNLKVDIYYYDGQHSYENQKMGLEMMLPYLAKKCIIFVDDINWDRVDRANQDFLKENKDFRSVFKVTTKAVGVSDWWNGFEIITRDV